MLKTPVKQKTGIFRPGHNCWKVSRASFLSPVIDCENYYRALHEAICSAQDTIFIVGWDIDSRIELVRDDGAVETGCPNTLFELLKWKSEQSPHVKVYLNRWNYSLFLAAQRESFSSMKWKLSGLDNVNFIFDDQIPLGGCHHQKIVVVDDEVAFCGGMDVAIARWDSRQHHIHQRKRSDPLGSLLFGMKEKYNPYHDVQMIVAGEVVKDLAMLVRNRWYSATGEHAKRLDRSNSQALPKTWPPSIKSKMQNAKVGISLTMPRFRKQRPISEIEALYIDMVSQAETFIYAENQFFTHLGVAEAINKRLKEKPNLRVLLISCKDPQGIMERKTMYHGRVLFRDALEAGEVKERVVMAYPVCTEHRTEQIRIHSKLMIVDNRYMRIGSSNLNFRSMGLDTECDLLVEGEDSTSRETIASIRNDLIREHTGRERGDIERIVTQHKSVQLFLTDKKNSRQHIRKIDDEIYRHEYLAKLAIRIGDSKKPILPSYITAHRRIVKKSNKPRFNSLTIKLIIVTALLVAAVAILKFTPISEYADTHKLLPFFQKFQHTSLAFPLGLAAYMIGATLFFPHIVLIAAIVMVFDPIQSFLIAVLGSLLSCTISYFVGRVLGEETFHALLGKYSKKISEYTDKGGVVALTVFRLLPTAPFTAENIVFGMMKIPYLTVMAATLLGMLPGTLLFVFLGKSATELWKHPEPDKIALVGVGIVLWVGLMWLTHVFVQRWNKTHR